MGSERCQKVKQTIVNSLRFSDKREGEPAFVRGYQNVHFNKTPRFYRDWLYFSLQVEIGLLDCKASHYCQAHNCASSRVMVVKDISN